MTGQTGPEIAAIVASLADQKATDVAVYRFSGHNAVADAFILATATSGRHARGLADAVLKARKERGQDFLHMEGYENAQWILVDCNDLIVHIFQEEARDLYRLDDLCRHEAREVLP